MFELVGTGNGYDLYYNKSFISHYSTLEEAVKMIERMKAEQE